jgi:hypothetical protein
VAETTPRLHLTRCLDILLPGVSVGTGSVVGAGAVVTSRSPVHDRGRFPGNNCPPACGACSRDYDDADCMVGLGTSSARGGDGGFQKVGRGRFRTQIRSDHLDLTPRAKAPSAILILLDRFDWPHLLAEFPSTGRALCPGASTGWSFRPNVRLYLGPVPCTLSRKRIDDAQAFFVVTKGKDPGYIPAVAHHHRHLKRPRRPRQEARPGRLPSTRGQL